MIEQSKSQDEIKTQKEKNKKVFFQSKFKFLKAHNGLRPGNVHGLISPTSSGKSSLLKSIIAETCCQGPVLTWLTEETIDEYQVAINSMEVPQRGLDNLSFVREKNIPDESKKGIDNFYNYLREQVIVSGCEAFFIDNITSSRIYDGTFGLPGQIRAAKELPDLAEFLDIPIFYLAHTKKEVTDNFHRLTGNEDIKGHAQITIESQFFYCMQKFSQNERQTNFIRTTKHRGYSNANGFYRLNWEDDVYWNDSKIEFNLNI